MGLRAPQNITGLLIPVSQEGTPSYQSEQAREAKQHSAAMQSAERQSTSRKQGEPMQNIPVYRPGLLIPVSQEGT